MWKTAGPPSAFKLCLLYRLLPDKFRNTQYCCQCIGHVPKLYGKSLVHRFQVKGKLTCGGLGKDA